MARFRVGAGRHDAPQGRRLRQVRQRSERQAAHNVKRFALGATATENRLVMRTQHAPLDRSLVAPDQIDLPNLPPPLDKQRRVVSSLEELATKIEGAAILQGHPHRTAPPARV
jgi:hypothetical protein